MAPLLCGGVPEFPGRNGPTELLSFACSLHQMWEESESACRIDCGDN